MKATKVLQLRVSGMVECVGVLLCLVTVLGFLGRFAWWLDLFSHFRIQYVLMMLPLAALLFGLRRRTTASVLLAFACVNLSILLPYMPRFHPKPPADARHLRVMLLNVNTRDGDPKAVMAAVRDIDPDVLVLEEISAAWLEDLAALAQSHPHQFTEPREDNFGIGLFAKQALLDGEVLYIGDADVPSLRAGLDVEGQRITLVATHPLPPGDGETSDLRNQQLELLPEYLPVTGPRLLVGDLNTTPWNGHFRRLAARTGLRDSSLGRGTQATWPTIFPKPFRIPIDFILHSPEIAIHHKARGPHVGSDHLPVYVDLSLRGTGNPDAADTKGP